MGEPISGWQTVSFSNPVHIASGTTYVASYHTKGYYSANDNYFTATYSNGLLKAMQGGGVYGYTSTAGTFPNQGSSNANYWVDVVFQPDPNMAPVAGDDSGSTIGKNGMLPISFASLLSNDSDSNQDPLSITAVGNATNGTCDARCTDGQRAVHADCWLQWNGDLHLHGFGWTRGHRHGQCEPDGGTRPCGSFAVSMDSKARRDRASPMLPVLSSG